MGGNKENKENKESKNKKKPSFYFNTHLPSSSEKYLGLLNGSNFSFFFINQLYNFSLILLLLLKVQIVCKIPMNV